MDASIPAVDQGVVLESRSAASNVEGKEPATRSGSQLWSVMRQAVRNKYLHYSTDPPQRKIRTSVKRGILRFLGLDMSDYDVQHWKCVQTCMMEGHQRQWHQSNAADLRDFQHFPKTLTNKPDLWKLAYSSLKRKKKKPEKSITTSETIRRFSEDAVDGLVAEYDYVKESWMKQQSIEGLLHLRYKYVNLESHQYLHETSKQRPYFTYWLMFVHIVIMIITLSVEGFAPYQWDITTSTAFVQTSSLTLEVARKNVTGSVWGGPDLESLVRLGAKYAPCMRRDRQLYAAIESDRKREAEGSGCCVRRDKSGCVQVITASGCPICSVPGTSTYPHLSCELTGRPCCVGLQAVCLITTFEHCNFLGGRYHSDAFLCSQVDCLSGVCGLIPFAEKDHPDQVYRLWLSLFLHAGILHLILSLLFNILVLRVVERRLGWFKTCFVYILSGVGGNIVSAVFVPYYPEVGPGSCIFGIVAYIFVFLLMECSYLVMPWVVLTTMSVILGLSLVMGVIFPFLDNFSHIGGFVFGFFLSWIVVQYKQLSDESLKLLHSINESNEERSITFDTLHKKQAKTLTVKYVMMGISIPASILLFVGCLIWLYVGQDYWFGFTYFNCIPYTPTFCQGYGQNLESRMYN